MNKIASPFAALAAVLVALVFAAPAQAAFVTFVSQTGSDAFDCISPAEPCATLGGALAKTNALGVMHVLPGQYAPLTIDKAVEIIADGGQASITGSAGDGSASLIVDAAPTDVVRIRGLIIDRKGDTFTNGIRFVAGAALHLEDCTLVNSASGFGLSFAPSGASELFLSNTAISGNGSGAAGGGILIKPTGSGSAKVVLDNVSVEDNSVGILVDGGGTSGAINMSIRDSVISGSTAQGLGVFEGVSGGASAVVLERTTISSNGAQGIFASRALASVRVRQSAITGNAVGIGTANGGQIISHGDNVLAGNTTNGAFTSTVAPQ